MKTILLVSGTMNFGGAEIMMMDIIRNLKNDFKFVFLINRKKGTNPVGALDEEIKSLNIPMYYIDAVWDVGIKEYERQFKEIVKEIGCVDICHCHLNSKGGIVSRCAKKCGIKRRIVHCHAKILFDGSVLSKLKNNLELLIQRFWIKKYATDFWGCSMDAMPSLFSKKQIKSDNAKIIHNAIDLQKFLSSKSGILRQELGLTDKDIIIGSVGRIAPVKNYPLAANIIKELWNRGLDIHYVVAGLKQDVSEADYMFNLLSSDARFHHIGVRSDTENVYKDFDLYLGTSKREGLGLSVVEAQACGTHCVVSSGFPKLCDMNTGLVTFVDSLSATVWADEIEKLLKSNISPDIATVEKAIKDAGFDIKTEAEKIKKYYD